MSIYIQKNIVAAFRGMHVSPAKQPCVTTKKVLLPDRHMDGLTDKRRTKRSLCFAGDTKN